MCRFALALVGFLGSMLHFTGAFAACAQIDGNRIPHLDEYLVDIRQLNTKMARHIEPLKNVYARIAPEAKIRPALWACDSNNFNASAFGDSREGAVIFNLPFLDFLDVNIDEIAAVMAHEMSHIIFNHTGHDKSVKANLSAWAKAIAQQQYQRTGDVNRAVQTGLEFREIEFNKYSRFTEREADDKGFSLAVTLAKFNGEGFKSFAKKLSKLPPSNRPPYLDSHPGWMERLDKADILTINQHYMDSARALFLNHNWKALTAHVNDWLIKIPESGAAWYYQGRILSRNSRNSTKITRVFEEAASLFVENPVLGTRSQEDQIEADHVWFYLCLALFDEGYKYESANCSRRISNESTMEEFHEKTFGGLLIVAGPEQSAGNLLVAREPDGSKLFTNDQSIAASRGAYKPVSPAWRAIRFPGNLLRENRKSN